MQRKFKALILCAVIVTVFAMLTACEGAVLWMGNNYPGNMEASYKYFNGTKHSYFNLKEGDTVLFTYNSKVKEGSLSIKIIDPDDNTVTELQSNQDGTEKIEAKKDGNYEVIIKGSKASGSYSVKWKIEKQGQDIQ